MRGAIYHSDYTHHCIYLFVHIHICTYTHNMNLLWSFASVRAWLLVLSLNVLSIFQWGARGNTSLLAIAL